jgi:flagellin
MNFGLKNNLMTLNLTRNIGLTYNLLGKSMEKLASGLRINHAADDPAGLIISEQMRSRIASLNQEIENISNQINKYATAGSAMLQLRGQLTELRSLALAAANEGGLDESSRRAYQDEADNIVNSYNSVIESAQFGHQELLDGSDGSVASVNKINHLDLSDAQSAGESIEYIDEEIEQIDAAIANVGATQKYSLESRLSSLRVESENLTAAESQIRDLDYALEYANFVRHQILLHSGMSLLAHAAISPGTVLLLMNG